MNMLYEGLKQNATLVIVPSTVLNTMTLGDMTGTVSLAKMLTEPGTDTQPGQKAAGSTREEKKADAKAPGKSPAGEPGAAL
jgi:hypothetical protein